MARYVALLRAVNVGGTGMLPMSELKAMCVDAGFSRVETYIASGNVVFDSGRGPAQIKTDLEKRLHDHTKKTIGVIVRSAADMRAVLKANPFRNTDPKFTYVIFLDAKPPRDALTHVSGQSNEEMRPGAREIYVHYPSGMGRSKLKIPAAKAGTARNMNTVVKLAAMASES